ncbi:MAG: hypothetical protein MZV64_44760 [Ignavibacteriales bacterium]|nr:hypothetical protein [Ignavibacteriales bacterium]
MDDHQDVRGLLLLRHGRTRSSCRSWSPSCSRCSSSTRRWRCASSRSTTAQYRAYRDHMRHDAARGHHAVVAGRWSPASRCSSSPRCTCTRC